MHTRQRSAQWPAACNMVTASSQSQLKDPFSKNRTCKVEPGGNEFKASTTGELNQSPICDKPLEIDVEMQVPEIVQKHIQSLNERILVLERRIQQLEEAIKEKPKTPTIIPLEGGISTSLKR